MPRRLLAAAFAAATLGATAFAPAAHADWRYHGRWGGGHWGYGPAIVGGALLGLGVGSLLAAPYVAPPPPVYYAPPPPAYYPPPYPYAPPPYYPPY